MSKRKVRFGESLKILRSKRKLSQENLAEQLNVTRQTVSAWESQVGKPDVYILAEMQDIFDVPLETLLYAKIDYESNIEPCAPVQPNEVENNYIKSINRKGYYDIMDEDLSEFFPIITMDVARILAIVMGLKEKYNIATIFANGFGIFFSTDEKAVSFHSYLYDILDNFMHYDQDDLAVDYYQKVREQLEEVEVEIIDNTLHEIFGNDLKYYWIDKNENIRGYGRNENECRIQAKNQNCEVYTIFEE